MSTSTNRKKHIPDRTKKIDRNRLLKDLFQQTDTIPPYVEGIFENVPVYNTCCSTSPFANLTVIVYPSVRTNSPTGMPKRSASHRITVVCERCEQEIPFGRYHQHYGSKHCKEIVKPLDSEQAFIEAIDSGDYLALSAYADWLDEQGTKQNLSWGLRRIVQYNFTPFSPDTYSPLWGDTPFPFPTSWGHIKCFYAWFRSNNSPEIKHTTYYVTKEEFNLLSTELPEDWQGLCKNYRCLSRAYFDLAKVLHKLYFKED